MLTKTSSIAQVAATALSDLIHYLSVIDPVTYQSPMDLLSGSSIGQHTRHIIEFYNCLIEQSATGPEALINYSLRRRDHLIESEPAHAIHYVRLLCDQIYELNEQQTCLLDCHEHGNAGMVASTIGRELIYNIEHTIHHLAIVKMALKESNPDLTLPEHFGVAPSTIRHRHEACAQ
jgi:hypothetical protein